MIKNAEENSEALDTSLDGADNSHATLESQRADAVSPRPSVQVGEAHDDFMNMDPMGHGFHSDSDDDESDLSLQQNTSNYASSIIDDDSLHNQVHT